MKARPETEKQEPPVEEVHLEIGRSRLHIRARPAAGSRLQVQISAESSPAQPEESARPPGAAEPAPRPRPDAAGQRLHESARNLAAASKAALAALERRIDGGSLLLGLALLVYLLTRLIGIEEYPIYFFTDEAVQTVLAADLVRDGFYSYDHELLPTFFLNSYQYNLGVSVYLQVIPYLLFGKAVWVTRGVSALVSLLAAVCAGLTLKNVFRSPYPWLATLFLSITPAWFLHSRTAFETSLAVSFYAAFLYFYLRYRTAGPRNLYPAVIMGALVFYTYSPARMVIGVSALFLLISDAPYHWRQRKIVLKGLGLALLLALPFVRFQIQHPDENLKHLRILSSYWIQAIPPGEKLGRFFAEYLRGFDPRYWYLPNDHDLARHLMRGYGHLLRWTFPLLLIGLAAALWKARRPEYRALLLALLAAPSGAALVALGITRALVMVVPAALLTAVGASIVLCWIENRRPAARRALVIPLFLFLALFNFRMLQDALLNGPRWHTDYGLGGMQYGARQVFGEIDRRLRETPDEKIILSPAWANGTDIVARFFYPDPLPFEIGSIDGYFYERRPLDDNTLFIMISEEYQRAQESGKFTDIRVEQTMLTPNNQPGFYFVRLRYVDDIGAILAAERRQRRVLQEKEIILDGQPAHVRYSYLDMGEIENIFDGDPYSLVRTLEANPLQVIITFNGTRQVQMVSLRIGGAATQARVEAIDAEGNTLAARQQEVEQQPNPRELELSFDRPVEAGGLRLEIKNIHDREPAHVHLWEASLE